MLADCQLALHTATPAPLTGRRAGDGFVDVIPRLEVRYANLAV